MITAKEAAAMLGLSLRSIYDLAAPQGQIPCARFGTRKGIRFEKEDIEEYKKTCRFLPIKPVVVGASRLTASSPESATALQKCFQKAGLKLENHKR